MNYKIKSRIWIEGEDGMFLGNGRVNLLKAIKETGSLSKAAKQMKLSYKKAWNLLDSVNKNAKEPVVHTATGGKDGGGAEVTPYGKELIRKFEQVNNDTIAFLNKQNPFG
jgi:molybdate transport system regulatory protein